MDLLLFIMSVNYSKAYFSNTWIKLLIKKTWFVCLLWLDYYNILIIKINILNYH